jgi:hypothetical protein
MPAKTTLGVRDLAIKKEGTLVPLIYYNCSQLSHVTRDCLLPKRMTDIKEMGKVKEVINVKDMSRNEDV